MIVDVNNVIIVYVINTITYANIIPNFAYHWLWQ